MLSFIFNMTILAVAAAFGWKAAEWQSSSKKLKAENKELKKELYYHGSENRELKIQLGLPPERRLALQPEPDLCATISDAQMSEERKYSKTPIALSGGVSPMMALLGGAAILHLVAAKKAAREGDE
jgi:hypothetical protein